MISGIYMIFNIKNDKKYIGSAKNFKQRKASHLEILRLGKHNRRIQPDFDIYGENSFEITLIENLEDLAQLVPREQFWLDYYKSYLPENGYNISPTAGSNIGTIYGLEVRQQNAILRKREWENSDIRSKRIIHRCMTISSDPEYGRRMSEQATNQWVNSKVRSNMTESLSKSIKEKWKDPEYRRKNIESNIGRKNSEESKLKVSITLKRLWSDPNFKNEMANTNRSKCKNNPEFKEKMSKVVKEWQSNPEYKKLCSDRAKNQWSSLEFRAKVAEGHRLNKIGKES